MVHGNVFIDELTLFFDGASRGNPGPAAVGGILKDKNGEVVEKYSQFIGDATNNEAEYLSLIEGLKRVRKYNPKKVIAKTDSELVVKQLNGKYAVKSSNLKPLFKKAESLSKKFDSLTIQHITRNENIEADALCNRTLDFALKERKAVEGKISVTVREKFDAAHFLRDYKGKCAELHGHTYYIEVTVTGSQLASNGILIDFGALKKIISDVLEELDHKYLNEIEPFKTESPTGENLAIYIAQEIEPKLPHNIRLTKVVLYEAPDAWITFEK